MIVIVVYSLFTIKIVDYPSMEYTLISTFNQQKFAEMRCKTVVVAT